MKSAGGALPGVGTAGCWFPGHRGGPLLGAHCRGLSGPAVHRKLDANSAPRIEPYIVLMIGLLVSGHAPLEQPTTLYKANPSPAPTIAPSKSRSIITCNHLCLE